MVIIPCTGGIGNTVYNIGGKNLNANFSGSIIDSNPTNLTCLVKTGTGTQVLNGNNSFTGTNTVIAGNLAFQQSATHSSDTGVETAIA